MKWELRSGNELLEQMSVLQQKKDVYIAGAGKYGKWIGKFLSSHNARWDGYVDKKIMSAPVEGKKVYSYLDTFNRNDFFIVSSYLNAEAIVNELKQKGVSDDNIAVLPYIREIIYDIQDFFVGAGKYALKTKKYFQQYRGQRCFVIGNGPSLRVSDLDKLKNEVTFACNSIYALYGNTTWRPTFYCAYDHIFCREMMSQKSELQKLISGCKASFTDLLSEGFEFRDCEELSNLFYVKIIHKYDNDTGLPLFSENCEKQIYSAGTVAYMMLQLAVYMGFQEIYLLGMDASYSVERHKDGTIELQQVENHQEILEEEEERFKKDIFEVYGYENMADVDMHLEGYKSAGNYADIHGIKIYNATRGGKLEVFERVNFDSLF